jgi:signal transduction histidine kinase
LERIAGGLAHEFSNLVAAFLGDLWAIRKNADDPTAVRQRAAEAEEAAIQGGRIIDQLLASVRQRPKSQAIQVNRLVEATWSILRSAAGEGISVEMDLAAAPDNVVIDPAHLQAALLNLVTNARDAMSGGGTVTLTTRNMTVRPETLDEPDLAPGRYIMLSVRDNGSGMSEDVLRHAFEPFFTTKEIGRGTGLGLAQVRAFAKHSGGTAHIESAAAKGTTVRIYLPQGGAAADNAATKTM